MDEKKSKLLGWLVILTVIVVGVVILYNIYQSNNFNEYQKREVNPGISKFERDSNEKYSNSRSYKITSEESNDAVFSKKIKVEKNTPYKITCMVKTENVVPVDATKGVGAQISIVDTTERSVALEGTNDWTKLEFIVNSKDRTELDVGFRLGGYLGYCKGTAWFSDFTLESGIGDTSNEWNFACFIFPTTDVTLNGKNVKIQLTDTDVNDIKSTIVRFSKACGEMSEGKMTSKCDIYTVNEPLSSLSYDKEFGYYVAPENVEAQIKSTIAANNYDHIFVIIKLGDENHQNDIQINDWIGLGSMDYYGIGYSNIRLPNSSKSYIYKYDLTINAFPEEVFLHEFLHSLERTSKEYGYDIPALHDYEKYGYKNEKLIGQKKWYADYMNKKILSNNTYIGLPERVYTLKPAKQSDFINSTPITEFYEPSNIIEEIGAIFNRIGKCFSK